MALCYFLKGLYHPWISEKWLRMNNLLHWGITLGHWTNFAVDVCVCINAWWYNQACTAVELIYTGHLFRSVTSDWAADEQCISCFKECSLEFWTAFDCTGSCKVWMNLKWLQHAWPSAVLESACDEFTHYCWMSLWLRWTSSNIDWTVSATQYRATICFWYHCSGSGYQSEAGSFLCTEPCWNWKDLLMNGTMLLILFTE